MNLLSASANRLSGCGLALRPWLWRTPLRDVAPALNGRANLAGARPCRTGAASFMVARARGRRLSQEEARKGVGNYVELAARMRVTACYSGAADDLRLADEILAQARTKQLPSTRTEIGAGGELIDREKVGSHLVDTVAHTDYVTAEASRDRLGLASQAGSLSLALDAADTIQAQDGLEKMLVHQMAVLHYGMMRAAARMNEELDAAGVIDPKVAAGMFDLNKREAAD